MMLGVLAPGHRVEHAVGGPPGERVGDALHEQEVRRAGEQEPPGPARALAIDDRLDREHEPGLTLHLVQNHRRMTQDKLLRIRARSHSLSRASVLLPVWRAPVRTATGKTARSAATAGPASRGG